MCALDLFEAVGSPGGEWETPSRDRLADESHGPMGRDPEDRF